MAKDKDKSVDYAESTRKKHDQDEVSKGTFDNAVFDTLKPPPPINNPSKKKDSSNESG